MLLMNFRMFSVEILISTGPTILIVRDCMGRMYSSKEWTVDLCVSSSEFLEGLEELGCYNSLYRTSVH